MTDHNVSYTNNFDASCPLTGTFYVCDGGSEFVGCCDIEPCTTGCTDGNVEPASFNAIWHDHIPDQDCPSGSYWYTCPFTTPTFFGCCESDPCNDGCPAGQVTAAFLSGIPNIAAAFLENSYPPQYPSLTTKTSSSATFTSSARTSSIATSPIFRVEARYIERRALTREGGATIALAALLVALIATIIVGLIFCRGRRRRASKPKAFDSVNPSTLETAEAENLPLQGSQDRDIQLPPRTSSQLDLSNSRPIERASTAQLPMPDNSTFAPNFPHRAQTSPHSSIGISESPPPHLRGSRMNPLSQHPPSPPACDPSGFRPTSPTPAPAAPGTTQTSTTRPSTRSQETNSFITAPATP